MDKNLELMVQECIAGFEAAGLETGMDKTFGQAPCDHRQHLWTTTNTRFFGQRQSHMSVRSSISAATAAQR